jgi:hypothetical protein
MLVGICNSTCQHMNGSEQAQARERVRGCKGTSRVLRALSVPRRSACKSDLSCPVELAELAALQRLAWVPRPTCLLVARTATAQLNGNHPRGHTRSTAQGTAKEQWGREARHGDSSTRRLFSARLQSE